VNIPESELTTTGLPAGDALSELLATCENLELTLAESLMSEVVEVELATRCGCDHGNDSVADSGSIR